MPYRLYVVCFGASVFSGCVLVGYDPIAPSDDDTGPRGELADVAQGSAEGSPEGPSARDAGTGEQDATPEATPSLQPDVAAPTLPADAFLSCGPATCSPAFGEVCCVAEVPGYPAAPPANAFSCGSPGAQCAMELACDSDDDCPTGKVCCLNNAAELPRSACTGSCAGPFNVALRCSAPSDCPTGQVCCGLATGLADTRYASVECTSVCEEDGASTFCSDDQDCTEEEDACQPSTLIPGRNVCRDAP